MMTASSSHGFDSPVSLFLSVYFAFTVFVASSPTNSGFSSTIVHSVAPTMPASCTSVWIPEAKTVTGAVFDATMTTDIVKAASFLLSLITTSPFHRISITEHQKFKKTEFCLVEFDISWIYNKGTTLYNKYSQKNKPNQSLFFETPCSSSNPTVYQL